MKKHILSSLIAVAAMHGTNSQAESLFEVYKLAKQSDPGLRAAQATYQAQKESVTVSEGNLYPSLTFSGGLTYDKTDSPVYDDTGLAQSLSLDMNYPIYSPALNYAVDGVKLGSQSAELDLENTEEDLALTTLTEYFQLLIAQTTLQTTQAQVKATESQLDRAKKQYEVGLASITDLQDTQAEYDSVRVSELSARSDVAYAQQALYQRTGRIISSIPELAKDFPIRLDPNMTVESLIAKARRNNKDIQALDINVKTAENNISIQKASGRTPTVSLTGSLSHANYNYSPDRSSTDGNTEYASIGLGVSIPLYSGGAINASVRQAQALATAAQEQRASSLQSIELTIRSLFLELQTSVAQIAAQEQLVRSRTSALEATKAGYDVGTRNLVELLDAQSNLYDAQNSYETARYNFIIQRLNLLEVTGELTEEEIKGLDKWLVVNK